MFTAGLGLSLLFLSIYLKTYIALLAVGIALFITLTLAVFTVQSTLGFNFISGFLIMFLALVVSYFPIKHLHNELSYDPLSDKNLPILYGSGLILGTVLIYRTCQIINNKTGISPKDYVYAVLHLYVEVVVIVAFSMIIVIALAHPRGRAFACRHIFRCGLGLCSHH